MNTKIVNINEDATSCSVLEEAGSIIKNGGLVAFPTETVYGLGGDAFNPESSRKIYSAKGRPSDNPLIVHIADIDDLKKVAKNIPESAYALADKFWPGPLTMILEKTEDLPKETTGGLNTVAVRFPENKVAMEFIKRAGGFVAAPSANKSGRPSPTLAKYVIEDLDGIIEMIIDGGDSKIGLESTIVDLTQDTPMILRPGFVTLSDLKNVLGDVLVDKTILDATSKEAPKAPGMKYRHYAPSGDLTVVWGSEEEVVKYINEQISHSSENIKTGVIATNETASLYQADIIKNIGNKDDEVSIAKNLFRILREFDDEKVDLIFSPGFEGRGVAMATMNRLLKAAGHKEVKV